MNLAPRIVVFVLVAGHVACAPALSDRASLLASHRRERDGPQHESSATPVDTSKVAHALSFVKGKRALLGSKDSGLSRKTSTQRTKETYYVRFTQTYMPHTKKISDELHLQPTHHVPGAHNTTDGAVNTGASCYQCMSGCDTEECNLCRELQYAADDVMPRYCVQNDRSHGFQVKAEDTCAKCRCCSLVQQSSCKVAQGVCDVSVEVNQCMDELQRSPLYDGSDPECTKLGAALRVDNFENACSSPCFPQFMTFYEKMYRMNCTEGMSPDIFEGVMCGKVCSPPVGCMEKVDELVDDLASDHACHPTLEAMDRLFEHGEPLSRGLCGGRCYSRVMDVYAQLFNNGCFECDADILVPPEQVHEAACPPIATPVPNPEGYVFDHCNTIVQGVVSLHEDRGCAWVHRALAAGRNLTSVCESHCFAKYLGVYEQMFAHNCIPGETVPSADDLKENICAAGAMQHPASQTRLHNELGGSADVQTSLAATTRGTRVTARVVLHLRAISVLDFEINYWRYVAAAVSHALEVPVESVGLPVDMETVPEGLEFGLAVKVNAVAGDAAVDKLVEVVTTGSLIRLLNEQLRNANVPLYVGALEFHGSPTIDVRSTCDPALEDVANLCVGIDGCPLTSPTLDCCVSLMATIGQGCDTSEELCGWNMTGYASQKCTVFSDELEKASEWYATHQSPSKSASTSNTFSYSQSPLASISASPSPSTSLSASYSAAPTMSPVDVFALEPPIPVVEVEVLAPQPPYQYWGKRQTCTTDDVGNLECKCNPGYKGAFCEVGIFHQCPKQCSDRGIACITNSTSAQGTCLCKPGYGGRDCSVVLGCKDRSYCSGKGLCKCDEDTGGCQCVCRKGYAGASCEHIAFSCDSGCSNHGKCSLLEGRCLCDPGFGGLSCNRVLTQCPVNCSGHGVCDHATGTCTCHVGFTGPRCDFVDATFTLREDGCRGCSGGGFCDVNTGLCKCAPGREGRWCERTIYAYDCADKQFCNGNGVCNGRTGECECVRGYEGATCDRVAGCAGNCNARGYCAGPPSNATCRCRMAFMGVDCGISKCPTGNDGLACSGRGLCEKKGGVYSCTCTGNAMGRSCNLTRPSDTPSPTPSPSLFSGLSESPSVSPSVSLAPDFACETQSHCHDNGICRITYGRGQCECFVGWKGQDCGTKDEQADEGPDDPDEFEPIK